MPTTGQNAPAKTPHAKDVALMMSARHGRLEIGDVLKVMAPN
jgi:hypothetical protein